MILVPTPNKKTRNYSTPYGTGGGWANYEGFWDENKIMPGSIRTIPRDEGPQPMRNNAATMIQVGDIYSNELANGDKDDDKELEKEDDMSDDIVDYNGHTNRGYGSRLPSAFFDSNHIMPGSIITTPREEGPMRNSLTQIGDLYSN